MSNNNIQAHSPSTPSGLVVVSTEQKPPVIIKSDDDELPWSIKSQVYILYLVVASDGIINQVRDYQRRDDDEIGCHAIVALHDH